MPLILMAVGVLLIITGVKGDPTSLYGLVAGDFNSSSGKGNFLYWITAIFLLGALGYYKPLQPVSRGLIVLVVLVLLLHNNGFFTQIEQAFGLNPATGQVKTNG